MFGKRSAEKSVTAVRLVEAAAQLFARHGFKATTTKEIAQLADLNEATLFRYFPRKPDLFLAALESHLNRVKFSRGLQKSLSRDDAPDIVLPKIVAFVLGLLTSQPELQSLLRVAGFEFPESEAMIREHFGPFFDSLCAYFKRSADDDVICRVEPTLAALGLLGSVFAHQLFRGAFASESQISTDPGDAAAAYASVWLRGLTPISDSMKLLPQQAVSG